MRFAFLGFLLIPIAAQAYVSWRIWQLLPAPTWMKALVVVLMALAFISLFGVFTLPVERMPLWLSSTLYEVGTSWVMILLYLFMLFVVVDVLHLLHVVPTHLLRHSTTGTIVVAGVMLVTFVAANIHYNDKQRVALDLDSHGLVHKPLKVVMLSDIHLGFHNHRGEFARWVDMINAENPDMVLVAGDIIDNNVYPLLKEDVAQEWHRIKAPVYACLGNHEYISGIEKSMQFYELAGIHLLRDSVVVVGDVCLIGRDDNSNRNRCNLEQLMQRVPEGKYTIVLDHQPHHLEAAEQCKVNFQFSGHTHRGQVWPISWITDKMYECSFGPWQRGNTQYYVSSGMGIWGGKFRIGSQSEYVVAEIH